MNGELYQRVKQELDGMEHVPLIAEGDGFALYGFQQGHAVLIVEHRDFVDFAPIHEALGKSRAAVVEAGLIGGPKKVRGEIKKVRPKGLFSKHKFLWAHLNDQLKVWNSGTQLGPSLVKVLKAVAKGAPVGSAPAPRPLGAIGFAGVIVLLVLLAILRWFFRTSFSG